MPVNDISPGLRARVALEKHGFRTAHALGQNFILDEGLLGRLLDLADIRKDDRIVEIGPGAGVMTALLSDRAAHVTAYEMDEKLRPVLAETLEGRDNVTVVFGDFMKVDLRMIEGDYRVVANLPYYITSDILTGLATCAHRPESITVMVQKEAADRLMSAPGQKNWSALSAFVRYYGDTELLADVPRTAFDPQPHVDSCLIRVTKRAGGLLDPACEAMLFRVIRAAFLMRRKKLTNNLKAAFGLTQEQAAAALRACGLREDVRGETLDVEELKALAEKIGSNS